MAAQDAISRDDVSTVLRAVRERAQGPVFVGPEDAPDAVVLAMEQYRLARRHAAVTEAIGSVRTDGIEPGPVGLAALGRVARGEIDFDDALAEVLAHYRRQ